MAIPAPVPGDGLDHGSLPSLIGFHLRFAAAAFARDFATALGPLGLTQKQHGVLTVIARNAGISQATIADRLGTDRVTMIEIVDRLSSRDLIRRARSSVDRRRQDLHITDAGITTLVEADALIAGHERRILADIAPQDLAALERALRVIHGRRF